MKKDKTDEYVNTSDYHMDEILKREPTSAEARKVKEDQELAADEELKDAETESQVERNQPHGRHERLS